jgi:hypothetical protein
MQAFARIVILPILALAAGCGGASDNQLRTRAAFDMRCGRDDIQIVALDSRTRGVTGCGQQETYVESCDAPPTAMVRTCTWVLNTDSRRTSAKAQ